MALDMIEAVVVAAYVENPLQEGLSKPTVKQQLAAMLMLFDWMVTGAMLAVNPASPVRGPKYVIKKGKTPVLTPDEARLRLDSINVSENSGLHDRALLAVMIYHVRFLFAKRPPFKSLGFDGSPSDFRA
jgi:integrase/recombinase XerD